MNILLEIRKIKQKEISIAKRKASLVVLKARAAKLKRKIRPFAKVLSKKDKMHLIAEIKPKSPSAGRLIKTTPLNVARLYGKSRADAISVLTDKKFFGGNLKLLSSVKKIVKQPVLRKDFILDEYQVYESFLGEADAILLITSFLSQTLLKRLYEISTKLGLGCLVEIHNKADLKKALSIDAEIIGINNRNLKTMRTDLRTTENLIKLIPKGSTIVSESGIESKSDVLRMKKIRVNAVLVGTSILRSSNPIKHINSLKV